MLEFLPIGTWMRNAYILKQKDYVAMCVCIYVYINNLFQIYINLATIEMGIGKWHLFPFRKAGRETDLCHKLCNILGGECWYVGGCFPASTTPESRKCVCIQCSICWCTDKVITNTAGALQACVIAAWDETKHALLIKRCSCCSVILRNCLVGSV